LQKLTVPVYHVRGVVCAYDPLFWWRMLQLVRVLRPDVIHASLWSAGLVSRVVGNVLQIPVITAVHALLEYHGRLRTALDRLTVQRANKFIAVSRDVGCSIERWLPNQQVQVIPNGIDVGYIHTVQQASVYSGMPAVSLDHFVIGSVGRFVPVKRYDLLLQLFAPLARQYAHVRLLLVGSGPREDALRKQAAQLGIDDKVFFVINQSALPLYPRMHCFVQTSLYEGLSIALLEAMATGLPCITISQDGQHELINHGVNGWVVSADNTAQIGEYIQLVMEDPLRYKKIGFQLQ